MYVGYTETLPYNQNLLRKRLLKCGKNSEAMTLTKVFFLSNLKKIIEKQGF
jgi:hypothetical protein